MKTQVFTNPQMVRYIEENYTFEDVINALMYYDTVSGNLNKIKGIAENLKQSKRN